jgi:Prokaryotic homologs of the JAB domain
MTDFEVAEEDAYRLRPMPTGLARGRLIVTAAVVDDTLLALRSFRGADGQHEGIVFWGGRSIGPETVITAAVVPDAQHTWGSVRVDERAVAAAARAMRPYGAGMLAQVHSHPGTGTHHSDGDDDLVLMPFEGMFSLIAGNYAAGRFEPQALGVHQFQAGRWVRVTNSAEAVLVVPRLLWA